VWQRKLSVAEILFCGACYPKRKQRMSLREPHKQAISPPKCLPTSFVIPICENINLEPFAKNFHNEKSSVSRTQQRVASISRNVSLAHTCLHSSIKKMFALFALNAKRQHCVYVTLRMNGTERKEL